MTGDNTDQIAGIAHEIAAYLAEHPHAGDTAEGVARWWVMRQRVEESTRAVQQALEHLLASGIVSERRLPDGTVIYTAAAERVEHSKR